LTAARVGEVIGARWSEFNMAERVWIVPAQRMKAGKEHRVPLSDAALAIVQGMAAICQGDFVFSGGRAGKPLSENAMRTVLLRMGQSTVTAHGMRSSFRVWSAERTAYPREVVELALAHSVGSAVEQAYQRSDLLDQRRRLMADWAAYCASTPVEGGDLAVRIRR